VFRNRLLALRQLQNDRLLDPVDQAAFWVDFFVRHKHVDKRWFKTKPMVNGSFIMDIVILLSFAIALMVLFFYVTLRCLAVCFLKTCKHLN